MRDWKTTTAGLVLVVAGFVTFQPELFVRWPWAVALAKYAMIGGFGALGIAGKDADKEVK